MGVRASLVRLTSIAAACVCASLCAAAQAQAAPAVTQGIYEGCAPGANREGEGPAGCAARLEQAAAAGFTVVLNYSAWYGSRDQVLGYAEAARRAGVKLIWPLNAPGWRNDSESLKVRYARLARACWCASNDDVLRYAIDLTRDLPATWGYYIGDELEADQVPAVAALHAKVKTLAPSHPTIYVANVMLSPLLALGPFAHAADWAGGDAYPVGVSDDGWAVRRLMRDVTQIARQAGRQPVAVLQSFAHDQYPGEGPTGRFPTREEMWRMRDQALAADPSMVLWYSMYDVLRSDDPTARWDDLVWAAFHAPVEAPRSITDPSLPDPEAQPAAAPAAPVTAPVGPAAVLRNPRLQVGAAATRRRAVQVRYRLARGARGRVTVKVSRAGRTIRARAAATGSARKVLTVPVPRAGRWTVTVRFDPAADWQPRTVRRAVTVR